MTHWSASYVGLPWRARGRDRSGVDCYGLVRLVVWERAGLALESYAEGYVTAKERAELDALIAGARGARPWVEIAPGDERGFDIALFRVGRALCHIGVVVEPGLVLHVDDGHDSEIIRYRESAWASRLAGFQRHSALTDRPLAG